MTASNVPFHDTSHADGYYRGYYDTDPYNPHQRNDNYYENFDGAAQYHDESFNDQYPSHDASGSF
jgi:hypothetical protein